eukprot:jgi/Chrzof1/8346/Cz03g07020.t1
MVPPSPKHVPPPSPGKPMHLQPMTDSIYKQSLPSTPVKSNLGMTKGLSKSPSTSSIKSMESASMYKQETDHAADNIKVAVRVRPMFPQEEQKGAANILQVNEDCTAIKVVSNGPAGATMQRDFQFHACLGPDTSQADVMHLCGIHQLLDAALAGYHVTIFAYGQTGSGKTHTMSGREDVISDDQYQGDAHDGIISRAVQYLFHQINNTQDAKYSLKASYLEIYNEAVFDLIHFKQKGLPVKWDATHGFYVQGLKVVPCGQMKTMMEVIRTGMKHRKVGSHQLNMESSRSHSIMTIYCDATPADPTNYDYGSVRYGKISFVDLAGSERVKDSKSEGSMLKETININKSLSVLGKVISILSECDAAHTTAAHIPYRDSKLTKLLMDSLGGSALTLMIACCSPSSLQVEETMSTLSYAMRAKNIQNRPAVQYDPREAQVTMLRREIELLRQENGYLREQLAHDRGMSMAGSVSSSMPTTPDAATLARMSQGVMTIQQQQQQQHGQQTSPPRRSGSAAYHPTPILTSSPGSSSPAAGTLSPATPNSFAASNPQSITTPSGAQSGLDELLAAEELVAGLRAHSNPSLPRRSNSILNSLGGPVEPARSAASETDLKGNTFKAAATAAITGSELLRRLKDTQGLLVRFSEENSRLARENDKLRGSKNVLNAEHATVLEEIDLLRGKLSQIEQSVLGPVASGEYASDNHAGHSANHSPDSKAPGGGGNGGIDVKALLANLGLGDIAVANAGVMGVGPLGGFGADEGGEAGRNGSAASSARSAYQGYGSARSDMSAPGDDASAMLRPLASPARSQLGSHGSVLGPGSSSSSNNSSSNIATAAKGIINRTPLTNRQGSDSTADDSIIVADKARLSLLLNNDPSNQSSAMARVNSPGYPGNPTSSAAEGFNQVAPPSSMQPSGSGDNGRLTPNQGVYGSNSPVPLSPHTAKFRVSSEIIAGAEAVYNQLPSSATSTLNRPLPVRPTGDRGTPMYASPKKERLQQQNQSRISSLK